MDNVSETQAAAFTPACVKLPAWAACLSAAVDGRLTHVVATKQGPRRVEGTGVSLVSPMHAQQPSIRKPYSSFTTRLSAIGGGDPGPHPAREPEPV
jgi:hypothetical protein